MMLRSAWSRQKGHDPKQHCGKFILASSQTWQHQHYSNMSTSHVDKSTCWELANSQQMAPPVCYSAKQDIIHILSKRQPAMPVANVQLAWPPRTACQPGNLETPSEHLSASSRCHTSNVRMCWPKGFIQPSQRRYSTRCRFGAPSMRPTPGQRCANRPAMGRADLVPHWICSWVGQRGHTEITECVPEHIQIGSVLPCCSLVMLFSFVPILGSKGTKMCQIDAILKGMSDAMDNTLHKLTRRYKKALHTKVHGASWRCIVETYIPLKNIVSIMLPRCSCTWQHFWEAL